MELSTPDPWLPATSTTSVPSASVCTRPRWYSVRPAFLRMGWVLRAFSRGAGWMLRLLQPIICSRAGRTKARKVTITATGLPGRPNRMALRGGVAELLLF